MEAEWISHMRRGAFAEAWRINEAVLAAREPGARDDPRLPYHLRWVWDGRSFDDRHVLVRCYHGLGDTLQFARFLPMLAQRAASVALEVQPALIPLLRGMPGVARVIPFDVAAPAPPSACDIEIMELAFALRATPDAVSDAYIDTPAAALPAGTVGLCWEAGTWDSTRSIPPALFEPFTAGPSITLLPDPTGLDVLNPEGCPRDMPATAALIAGAALVVTVDTMVAHLAGAMHRPTWLLLKHEADWRWMADRTDTPWYPTMRLYRQTMPGDWRHVVARVLEDWRAIAASWRHCGNSRNQRLRNFQ